MKTRRARFITVVLLFFAVLGTAGWAALVFAKSLEVRPDLPVSSYRLSSTAQTLSIVPSNDGQSFVTCIEYLVDEQEVLKINPFPAQLTDALRRFHAKSSMVFHQFELFFDGDKLHVRRILDGTGLDSVKVDANAVSDLCSLDQAPFLMNYNYCFIPILISGDGKLLFLDQLGTQDYPLCPVASDTIVHTSNGRRSITYRQLDRTLEFDLNPNETAKAASVDNDNLHLLLDLQNANQSKIRSFNLKDGKLIGETALPFSTARSEGLVRTSAFLISVRTNKGHRIVAVRLLDNNWKIQEEMKERFFDPQFRRDLSSGAVSVSESSIGIGVNMSMWRQMRNIANNVPWFIPNDTAIKNVGVLATDLNSPIHKLKLDGPEDISAFSITPDQSLIGIARRPYVFDVYRLKL